MRVVGISVLQGRRQSVSRTLAFGLFGTCLVGQGREVCWVNFFPDMSGAQKGEPAAATQVQCIGGIGLLGEDSQGLFDLDVKFTTKFDLIRAVAPSMIHRENGDL